MDHSDSTKNKFQWKTYLFNSGLNSSFSDQLKTFIQEFEIEWAAQFSNVSYELCQLESGNRLRPIVAFLGYLISETEPHLTANDFKQIIKVGICIELIHKSSLIIDDIIDNDSLRNGKPTFHVTNGQDKAIVVAFNLMSKSYKLLMEEMNRINISERVSLRCLEMSINIINDMSTGLLTELSMDKVDFSNLKLAEEIIRNETASIIKNSLVIGYILKGGDNQSVVDCLNEIGENCGYMFQVMNDMEPYKNGTHYKNHKGKHELEFFYNRKNIVTTYILQLMSSKEKENFYVISSRIESNAKLFEYFNKHDIYKHFISEIEEIENDNMGLVDIIMNEGINKQWCDNCKDFIKSLIEVAFSRLS